MLTCLDQLLFILKILLTLFKKQATLIRRSTVLSLPFQLVFPDLTKVFKGLANTNSLFYNIKVIKILITALKIL